MHRRKGFTLAELLIVVVITAVITSMVMISSRESASAANAGRIIDSLVNLSMAAMTLYSNSTDHFAKDPDKPANLKPYALRYMYSEIGANTDNFMSRMIRGNGGQDTTPKIILTAKKSNRNSRDARKAQTSKAQQTVHARKNPTRIMTMILSCG